jgi:hypothetical protein
MWVLVCGPCHFNRRSVFHVWLPMCFRRNTSIIIAEASKEAPANTSPPRKFPVCLLLVSLEFPIKASDHPPATHPC